MDKFDLIYGPSEKTEITPSSELLPCPFCGGKAEISGKFPQGQFYIGCTVCRCSMWYDRKDKVIGMWNSRKV